MSRIKELQKYVHRVLRDVDPDKRANAAAHLHGVSLAAVMIAKKRGENAELAAMAGLLHDLWAYKSGSYEDHARLGAQYARKVLAKLEITSEEETEAVCRAILRHDDKAGADGGLDEVLKDADVVHHSLADPTKEVKPHERERYLKLCREFGFAGGRSDNE